MNKQNYPHRYAILCFGVENSNQNDETHYKTMRITISLYMYKLEEFISPANILLHMHTEPYIQVQLSCTCSVSNNPSCICMIAVHGICFTFDFLAKNFRLASLMSVHMLVLSYFKITNLSIECKTSSGISLGAQDNCSRASVSSGYTFQIFQAVFFP